MMLTEDDLQLLAAALAIALQDQMGYELEPSIKVGGYLATDRDVMRAVTKIVMRHVAT